MNLVPSIFCRFRHLLIMAELCFGAAVRIFRSWIYFVVVCGWHLWLVVAMMMLRSVVNMKDKEGKILSLWLVSINKLEEQGQRKTGSGSLSLLLLFFCAVITPIHHFSFPFGLYGRCRNMLAK